MTPDRTLEKLAEGVRLAHRVLATKPSPILQALSEERFRTHCNPAFVLEVAREVERLTDEREVWFVEEVRKCAAIGMPLGCCGEWPECSHILAWTESRAALANPAAEEGDHD